LKTKWTIPAIILTMCVLLSSCSTGTSTNSVNNSSQKSSDISVVDDVNRTVKIPSNITRAAVISRYNVEIIRALGAIKSVAAVDDSMTKDSTYWPEFSEKDSFGGSSSPDYEKIASFKPQVFIISRDSNYKEAITKLEPFNIPVVVMTGWDNAKAVTEIEIAAKVFNRTNESKKLVSFYNDIHSKVTAIAKEVPQSDKKSVYWESIKSYSTTVPGTSNSGWDSMITAAGGINIYGDTKFAGKDSDPEYIVQKNPDFIFKMVAGTKSGISGYIPPTADEFKSAAQDMISRSGFSKLKAVTNGSLYMVTSFSLGGLDKIIGEAYMVKWLYPDKSKDINPDQLLQTWLKTYQNVDAKKGYYYQVK